MPFHRYWTSGGVPAAAATVKRSTTSSVATRLASMATPVSTRNLATVSSSQRVMPVAGALAAPPARAAPLEGGGRRIPPLHRRGEPRLHLVGRLRMLALQGAAHQNALHRLGHVQPRAAERGVERHDPAFGTP